jgi:hypothetical protein
MRLLRHAWIAATIVLSTGTGTALAADLFTRPVTDNGSVEDITLYGDITAGDADALDLLIRNRNSAGTIVRGVNLYSQGGLVREGISLGRVIRKYRLTTFGPYPTSMGCPWIFGAVDPWDARETLQNPNCACNSACALAWLGGVERGGSPGFHRAYVRDEEGTLSFGAQEESLEATRNAIESYMREIRAPSWLLDRMFSTSSDRLYFPDREERRDLTRDPLFSEFLISRCGPGLSREQETAVEEILSKKLDGRSITPTEQVLVDTLGGQNTRYVECERRAYGTVLREVQQR